MGISRRAIAISVILVVIIGALAYYAYPQLSTGQRTTSLMQYTSKVTSVDSAGGHFSLDNIGFCSSVMQAISGCKVGVMSLTSTKSSALQFGENLDVRMVYLPNQQIMYESFGKVISVSGSEATVAMVNASAPSIIPIDWNPKLGNEVVLHISTEESTQLVAITSVSFSGGVGVVDTPACLYSPLTAVIQGVCVFEAGQTFQPSITVNSGGIAYHSVSINDSNFSISGIHAVKISGGSRIDFTLLVPSTDFVGEIHMTLS